MRDVFLLLVLVLSGGSATAQVHDVNYQGSLGPLNITPTFDHGYLVVYDRDDEVEVFAPDGALMYSVPAKVPGCARAWIRNGAVDTDGTMAAAVQGVSDKGKPGSSGVALFDRVGSQFRFVDTGGYLPTQVAFGPDHSVWTIGYLGLTMASFAADYAILRNYARDGRELGQYLPRASFPKDIRGGGPLIDPMVGRWELRVTGEQVDIIMHRAALWVQTDLKGKERGRWDIAHDGGWPFAITQDGKAWHADPHSLTVFDRAAGVWRAVPCDLPSGNLVGAEGNNLVFMLAHQNTLRWVPAPGGSPVP